MSKFKAGDKVLIGPKVGDGGVLWVPAMDRSVGQHGTVNYSEEGDVFVNVGDSEWWYPTEAITLVVESV
jgi:hypothetical protein